MKQCRSSECIIVSIIIACAVALSMSQTILYILQAPQGFVYPYVHNFAEDYYYYLHIMWQGWEGNWMATSRLGAEQFAPQFIVVWLLFLGQVARIFSLSLPVVYTLARASGAMFLFVLVYTLIRYIWPKDSVKRVTGLIFVLFGTYFWGWGTEGPIVAPLVRAWTALDPLFRGSYIPHHLWSKVFMIGSFMYIASAQGKQSFARVIMSLLLVVIMSLASPVSLLPFVLILFPWGIVEFVKERKHTHIIFVYWILALVLSLGLIVFYVNIEQSVFPWTTYKQWEETMRFPVTVGSYLQAIGPTGILFLFGAWTLFRHNAMGRLVVFWALVPAVELFILGPFLPLSTIRFLDNYEFIPLGIGAAQGLYTITHTTLFRICVSILCFYFLGGIIASWNQQTRYIEANTANEQVYIPKDYINAFQFLETQHAESVVLAPYTIGTMLPAFTGMRAVAGHALMTRESNKKQTELDRIYNQGDSAVLRSVIARDTVSYIWASNGSGLHEILIAQGYTQLYANARVTVFAVKDTQL